MENVQRLRISLLMAPNEVDPFIQMPANVIALEGLYSVSDGKSPRTTAYAPPGSMSRRSMDPVWPTGANQRCESSRQCSVVFRSRD